MNIFDSHGHYDDSAFDGDREELLQSLKENNVVGVVNPGSSVSSSLAAVELSKKYDFIYAAVGIHPEEAQQTTEQDIETLKNAALSNKKVIAIGEIGLDYHYDECPHDIQIKWFERQVELANELHLPVIIHDRDAHADTMEILKKYRPRGVVHCYTGSAEMAKELINRGFYIGFTGVVTFKNAKKPVEAAAVVPLDRLLIETDCPYMAPEPLRGRRCDSTMLKHTLNRIASIKELEPEAVAEASYQNTKTLFGIK